MSENNERRIVWMIPLFISLVGLAAQLLITGVWVGGTSKQVEINTQWIRDRNNVNIDARLAVIENRLIAIDSKLLSTDRSVEDISDALRRHMDVMQPDKRR